MRTRREVLMMAGSGAAIAAIPTAIPAFFPTKALAQGNAPNDPLLREITQQFDRVTRRLASTPPRGNSGELAALFRVTSAWARANKLDTTLRQRLEDAIASEGHNAFVARVAGVDRLAAVQQLGITPPQNIQNLTPLDIAKGVGWLRAGETIEKSLSDAAWLINHEALTFDNRMAVLNKQQPEGVIRRVQDPVTCTYDPSACPPTMGEDGCTVYPDGSVDCYLGNPQTIDCEYLRFVMATFGYEWEILAMILPELAPLAVIMQLGFAYWVYFVGC